MEQRQQQVPVEQADLDLPDLDYVTAYEDDDALVICDKQDPTAWIRSDSTTTLDP